MVERMRAELSTAELPQNLQFNKYAQQILENGKSVAASTPTITTLSGSEFLQKISASFLNHLQTYVLKQNENQTTTTNSTTLTNATSTLPAASAPSSSSAALNMDFEIVPNHVVIGSSDFDAMDELQKQLEYDKFMNEVWIGIVFTLVLISMVFCICSCFLYHQFRTWKRNYNASVEQSQAHDIESMKLYTEHEDPVPEYTLVSGLPTYEAALELLQKTPNSCVIMYPSLFGVFNKHEKCAINMTNVLATMPQQQQQHQQQLSLNEATRPLLATDTLVKSLTPQPSIPSYADATTTTILPTSSITEKSEKAPLTCFKETPTSSTTPTTTTLTTPLTPSTPSCPTILQKVPSYEEALLVKTDSLL